MNPRLFILFFIVCLVSIASYALDYLPAAQIGGIVGLVILLIDRMPKARIGFSIFPHQTSNGWMVRVENLSSGSLSKIRYEFQGRLVVDDLPTDLEAGEVYEELIGLSFDTGTQYDVRIYYRPQLSLFESSQRFRGQAGARKK
jgi:hypothetical protein